MGQVNSRSNWGNILYSNSPDVHRKGNRIPWSVSVNSNKSRNYNLLVVASGWCCSPVLTKMPQVKTIAWQQGCVSEWSVIKFSSSTIWGPALSRTNKINCDLTISKFWKTFISTRIKYKPCLKSLAPHSKPIMYAEWLKEQVSLHQSTVFVGRIYLIK